MQRPTALAAVLALALALAAPALSQSAQPQLMEDIWPGPEGSEPLALTPVGAKVVFSADDGVNGREPWVSDGTAAGTFLLADLEPPGGWGVVDMVQYGHSTAYIATRNKLWKTDGTAAGTILLKDFVVPGTSPRFLAGAGAWLYFAANDGLVGMELWKTDGTPAGTVLVKDIHPGPSSSMTSPSSLTAASLGSLLFFAADDGVIGSELWFSDGTAGGTQPWVDAYPGPTGSSPYWVTTTTGRVWYRANVLGIGQELVMVTSPPPGTATAFDLNPGSASAWPTDLTQWGTELYFGAETPALGMEPWVIDLGTLATRLLADVNPGPGDGFAAFGPRFYALGNRLYFPGDNGTHGNEPWSTDGTTAGTAMLRDLAPGPASSDPSGYVSADGEMLFTASTFGDRELWRTDGTGPGTLPFWPINPGGDADVGWPVRAGSYVFVSASDGSTGEELYAFSNKLSGSTYCTAGQSASGCWAGITSDGVPSRSETDGFWVHTKKAEGQKDGIFFFGTNGRQANPWGNGSSYQCVVPPVRRTPLRSSGGSAGACNGSHDLDFNDWMATNPLKAPVTGDLVQMQCWYRDPLNSSNQTTSLSSALEFTIYP